MCVIRINAKPELVNTERVRQELRRKLPLAYIKPTTGRDYFDFILDLSDDDSERIQDWLRFCGWEVEKH